MDKLSQQALQSICEQLRNPIEKDDAERLEASLKAQWRSPLENGMNKTETQEFISYFANVGFVPKFKSYGVKYAAPFGYSLFDLKDDQGFSVQIHKEAKVEAFHILKAKKSSFMVLCSLPEWEENKDDFLELWSQGRPTESPIAHTVRAGDVAVVSDLNIVHTVIGCVLEEYATSSYDVVDRLHDQNSGSPTILPQQLMPISALLPESLVEPTCLLENKGGVWSTNQLPSAGQIVSLPDAGLLGEHHEVGDNPVELATDEATISTVIALQGDVLIEFEGFQQVVPQGGTTATPPGSTVRIANASQFPTATAAVCSVDFQTAMADLRQLVD